jgi:hypothetical protein
LLKNFEKFALGVLDPMDFIDYNEREVKVIEMLDLAKKRIHGYEHWREE